MRPSGPLMIEHRLIEKMVELIKNEINRIEKGKEINTGFINDATDFFRVYADRTHHGKEEDILFESLKKKKLSAEDLRVMDELAGEHVHARSRVKSLVEANNKYARGDKNVFSEILNLLKELAGLYPPHIEKEDKVFFPAAMKYYSAQELDKMLDDFWEFDKAMIHAKYKQVVEKYT